MIHGLEDVRQGFDVEADVVVVGSGAGGAMAAANFAEAGLRVVVVEAGPHVTDAAMTRDGPQFLARYYWEGGLRMIGGSGQFPSMQGRCLGGSTVVNSAIMLKLPEAVRARWVAEEGLDGLADASFDRAFARVMAALGVTPTPMAVMGRKNLVVRDVLGRAGLEGYPLPRAVRDCLGCGDCLTGCADGRKQSVDRALLPTAVARGAHVYTHAEVERVLVEGSRAVGVRGTVVDPEGWQRLASFTVRAPRVVMAAGVLHTPLILTRSGMRGGGLVGNTLYAHIGAAAIGHMDEVVDPWIGATQGWGAYSTDIPGLKYESLWAPTGLIAARWGDVGPRFLEQLAEVRHAATVALVYAGNVKGRVRRRRNGLPAARIRIPTPEMHTVMRGLAPVVQAFLDHGARFVTTGIRGVPETLSSAADVQALLSPSIRPRHIPMTMNHVFGSCRMSADPRRGPVDAHGALRDVEGLHIVDSSIFPGPSAVNPQATVMALSDVISRRLADLAA